ncbi:MAG TPA: MarR family transcriptional regulator [Gaiellaceae bacterium]|nr:MarR family transcriptional regulator [Gaiellaceae bacterium]
MQVSRSAAQAGDGAALVGELERLFSSLARTGSPLSGGSLTTTQRLVLIELVDSGPLRLGTLAERIGATDPTVSRAIDGLVQTGVVDRKNDPDDRRAVLHDATERGRDWVTRRRAEVAAALDGAVAQLSPTERRRLLSLIGRLNDELRAETNSGYPTFLAAR